ncbi:hypothetical protein RV12_GL001156 [Enterococcus quebecensis]|nr:hypothetical protein RV12_GL001156 [Enterococcus quebecensis]
MIGVGTTQTVNTADAAFSKDEIVRKRFALKKERLSEIVTKKIAHVENSIKIKLKEQEAKKIQKQKEETDKKAEEDKKKAIQEEEKERTITQNQTIEPTQGEDTATASNQEEAEAVSGASAIGRERGQKNREWGEQLQDPNLTREERQGIIQEKKNYNRNNHR